MPQPTESAKSLFPLLSVIHHRRGVTLCDACGRWRYEFLRAHIFQFSHPPLYILAFRIIVSCLGPRILNAEIGGGIGSCPCAPLPSSIIRGDVAVDQFLQKILFPLLPMNMQIFGQKHCHNHANSVVHVADFIQLSHTGINNREAGGSFAPAA